jgi:hypothetical protein
VAIESFAAISAVVTAIIPTQPHKRKFVTPSPINSAFKLSPQPGKWAKPGKTLAIAGGIGLRYKVSEGSRTILRLDYAINREGGSGWYVRVNEAF